MIMIIHYDKYHPNMCIDPIISFMDRFMGEAKYAFKNQHHHEQVNEGTDWCGFKQMVLIRSDHTQRPDGLEGQCLANRISTCSNCQKCNLELCPEL